MMQINELYRIRKLDALNIVIEKLVDVETAKTGEFRKEWQIQGYFSKVEHAINYVRNDYTCDIIGNEDKKISIVELLDQLKNTKIKVEIVGGKSGKDS